MREVVGIKRRAEGEVKKEIYTYRYTILYIIIINLIILI